MYSSVSCHIFIVESLPQLISLKELLSNFIPNIPFSDYNEPLYAYVCIC